MKLLNDLVAVQLLQDQEEKTAGGIITTIKKAPLQKGVIKHASQQAEVYVSVGDTVIFPSGSGTDFLHLGEGYLLMPVSNLKAIV